jgi:nucleoside-diphosphate-sugar epimerase
MRILITGATGVIGRRVVPMLVAAGHHVSAVVRSPQKRAALAHSGASAIPLDLLEPTQVRRAVAGHDTVINLATHMPSSTWRMLLPWAWRENDRVRRDGSRTLVDASIAEHVGRFIQESFAPSYEPRGEEWIDESVPLKPVKYNTTVLDAEQSAARFAESGKVGIVLRFAAFYGPDAFTLRDMMKAIRRGFNPLPGAPAAYVSSIAHDDAATAVVAALGLHGGVYNVCDDEPVRRSQYAAILAQCAGASPPRAMPGWTAALMGSTAELLGRSQRMSNQKLRAAAPGWVPEYRSVRDGLPAAIKAMRA